MRDFQRQRCYDAEHSVRRTMQNAAKGARTLSISNSTITLPLEVRFGSLDAIQRYVDQVLALDPVRERFPREARQPIRVRHRKADHHAHYQAGSPAEIAIHQPDDHTWACREMVVLHEIAHHLAQGDQHGPKWAGAYLWLVGAVIGPEVALVLVNAYVDAGVKWIPIPA